MTKTVVKMLKSAVLLLLFSGELCNRRNLFIAACNNFNDYCDDFNEEQDAVYNSEDLEVDPLLNAYANTNNYPANMEPDNRNKQSDITVPKEDKTSRQITTILDKLLFQSGYDRQIRPQIQSSPVEVGSK